MQEHLMRLRSAVTKHRNIPFVERFERQLYRLSPGDTGIALILGAALMLTALGSAYSVLKTFLVEVPSDGGTLTEGVVGNPRFVNPLLALTDADRDLATLTYAGLMGYDKNGALVPVLAESYEISPDGKVYTFRLRDNLTFSDGKPLTASDVVFTIEKAQDPGLKSPELANWVNVLAEAVDTRTVRFTLPKAYAPFLNDATLGILPSHIWKSVSNEEFPFAKAMSEPVGAGPFKVASVLRDKNGSIEQYTVHAFSEYALGKPHLASITFVFFKTQSDLAEAYERGRVESAHSTVTSSAEAVSYSRVFGVFWNGSRNPLFARAEVRKALSQALDRTTLVNETLGGYATEVAGPVPPGIGVSIPSAGTPEGFLETARETLANNGWTFDEAAHLWKHEKDGLELTVTIDTASAPELRTLAEHVKSDFEALGVPVSLRFHDASELVTEVIRPRTYDALLFGMVIGHNRDLYAFWDSSQRSDPGLNVSLYASRAVDELLEEAREEQDPNLVSADLARLNDLIAADYPAAFTHAPQFLYSTPRDLKGVVLGTVVQPSDRLFTAAFWYRKSELVWPIFVREK